MDQKDIIARLHDRSNYGAESPYGGEAGGRDTSQDCPSPLIALTSEARQHVRTLRA